MDDINPGEELLSRHRKEKKKLQGEIQGIKKSVPKGDKKALKAAKLRVEELEKDLQRKHKKELDDLNASSGDKQNIVAEGTAVENETNTNESQTKPRVSKAQKRRNKKEQKMKEQAEAISNSENNYEFSARAKEEREIKKTLQALNFVVKPMIPDGNCMYYAIHDQLNDSHSLNIKELRHKTAEYMRNHSDEFVPYITHDNPDQMADEESFQKYCENIEMEGTWGGQLELRALSHILKSTIHVIQASAPSVIIGDEYNSKPIYLTYHRHELGLGEHYNSVERITQQLEDL